MALANVGFLLAQQQSQTNGRGVLLVDWDLEAPGLHRYFRDAFRGLFRTSADRGLQLDRHPGLIDLFVQLRDTSEGLPEGTTEISDESENELRDRIHLRDFILETNIEGLHFLKAGRFDSDYSRLVNTFDWEGLYRKAPWLIPWLAGFLAEHYEYVLIDSRTGLTDTSGICTALLPERLVIVFTPNLQSTEGALEVVERATEYRRRSDDLRPLIVFPLPSRIESARENLRDYWRFDPTIGYQPRFEELFERVYGLPRCDLTLYFDEIQIQHIPDYAYGEEIAAMVERGDRLSLTRSYQSFTDWLLKSDGPWEPLHPADNRSAASDLERRAFSLMAQMEPDEAVLARGALLRLVRVGPEGQSGSDIGVRINERDFPDSAQPLLEKWISAGVLRAETRQDRQGRDIELADDTLIETWTQLKTWIDKDRPFLTWRQRLDDNIAQWESRDLSKDFLLRGLPLSEAQGILHERSHDLNEQEKTFIAESVRIEEVRSAYREYGIAAAALFVCLCLLVLASKLGKEIHYIQAINLIDSRSGWAVSSSISENLILVTNDNGRKWSEQPAGFKPQSVYFDGSSTGWVVGTGGILMTTDGGETWTGRTGQSLNSIFFVDRQRGWAVGDQGLILATVDGGRSWEAQVSGVDATLNSVHFITPQNGLVVGENGQILTTGDGGRTWSRKTTLRSASLQSGHLVSPGIGWIVGYEKEDDRTELNASDKNLILKTRDGGESWRRQDLGLIPCCFRDVDFVSDTTGWVVGVRTILKTTDGGTTWVPKDNVDYSLKTVDFLNTETGWAAGEDVILSTVDGGQTWEPIWPISE